MNSRTQTNKKEQNFHLLPTKRATIQEPKIKKTKRLKNTHINLKETPQQQHKHSEWKSDGPDGQSDNKTRWKSKQSLKFLSLYPSKKASVWRKANQSQKRKCINERKIHTVIIQIFFFFSFLVFLLLRFWHTRIKRQQGKLPPLSFSLFHCSVKIPIIYII